MTQVPERDSWSQTSVSVGSGSTVSKTLDARGAREITGIVDRGSTYDIDLVWLDPEGNDIVTESVASGVSGKNTFSKGWRTAEKCRVEITDTSASSGSAAISIRVS